jgi:hypothetical protein
VGRETLSGGYQGSSQVPSSQPSPAMRPIVMRRSLADIDPLGNEAAGSCVSYGGSTPSMVRTALAVLPPLNSLTSIVLRGGRGERCCWPVSFRFSPLSRRIGAPAQRNPPHYWAAGPNTVPVSRASQGISIHRPGLSEVKLTSTCHPVDRGCGNEPNAHADAIDK